MEERAVLDALSTVRDPELDRSITELDFVESVTVSEDAVHVRLRLPTYFCAPNFAFMMAADAREAVRSMDGVGEVSVVLADHFASEEINDGLAHGRDFQRTFPEDDAGDLDELRGLFRRKAFVARRSEVCDILLRLGLSQRELVGLTLGDLPPGPETDAYLRRRAELGLDTDRSSPFLVTPDGTSISEEEAGRHLRFGRTVARSIEGNAAFCRGLLRTRYDVDEEATT